MRPLDRMKRWLRLGHSDPRENDTHRVTDSPVRNATAKRSENGRSRLRMIFIAEGLTIITSLGAIGFRGTRHGITIFIALTLYTVGRALWESARKRGWLLVALAIVVALWAYPKSGPSPAQPSQSSKSSKSSTTQHWLGVGTPHELAVGAKALSANPHGLTAMTDLGAVAFDPMEPTAIRSIPLAGADYFDLASDGLRLVAVHAGRATVYDFATLKKLPLAVSFNEGPGRVAVGFGSAWLCSTWHSKVDRFDLTTGELREIPVPAAPDAIVVGGDFIWISLADGLVARIDPRDNDVKFFPTQADPEVLAYAFDSVWSYHRRSRSITQANPITGQDIGPPIDHAGADVVALASFGDSLFAVSEDNDDLERIDPKTHKIIAHTTVPGASGLAVFNGRLWVTSATDGTFAEVLATPLQQLYARKKPRRG